MQKNTQSGFTLVEIAIVMIIIGVLLAGVTSLLVSQIKAKNLIETQNKLEAIDQALQVFLEANGTYPCAAPNNALPDTANFGVALDCAAANVAAETAQPGSPVTAAEAAARGIALPHNVRIGSVPTRTISLPDDYAFDAWGRRFTYAITEVLTTAGGYNREHGGVSVLDSGGNTVVQPVNSGHYLVVSHGETGDGAIPRNGGVRLGCPAPAATLDEDNCDDDGTFVDTILANDNANFFDDIVLRKISSYVTTPRGAVVAFNLAACPAGWNEFQEARGRFVIGTGQYVPNPSPYVSDGTGGLGWNANTHDFALLDNDEGNESYLIAPQELPYDLIEINPASVLPLGSGGQVVPTTAANPVGHEPINNLPPFVALRYCEKQ